MLSVFARPHLFKLNKLLEPAKLNLLLPKQNLNRTQLQSFRTRRSLENLGINVISNQSQIRQLFDSKLFRASASAIGGSALFFAASAVWSYELLQSRRWKDSFYKPNPFGVKQNSRNEFTGWWSLIKDHEKLAIAIIGLNLLVFAAWRVPRLEPLMYKYFTVNISKKSPTFLPMVLSVFSHHNATHLLFNMFCLHSFAGPLAAYMGNERLLALYLSAGMFGSLASILLKLRQASVSYSLGASAGILGLVACVCILRPESQISILFLPMISFSAQNALLGILAMDTAGLLLGWKVFDHAGHLGGTLFGVWYTKYGHKITDKYRKKVASIYHRLRSPKK